MSEATQLHHDSRRTIRVLVADADDETRAIYRESLQLAGCDVVDAVDGRDALVKALSHRPTVVITDTRLPIFDGYALCDVLRRDSMTRGVPILVVTTEARPTELDRALDAGADVVLRKPVSLDTLLKEIQQLLQQPARPNASARIGRAAAQEHHEHKRTSMTKAHARFETKTPPAHPPDLVCPSCDSPLIYQSSYVGGVNSRYSEQWDYYTCPATCGTFEYRQRTRKIRRAADIVPLAAK
jgi:CheY-like chemotaxis protein